jgi:uncharacterized protein (DUF1330 family)
VTQSLLALSIGIAIAAFALFTITRKSSRYALVDLVETKTPDEVRSFVTKTTQHAEDMGGQLLLAHKMLPPVVIPDQRAADADRATNLLVITEYPSRAAGESAFADRANWAQQHACRTYATRPMHLTLIRIIAALYWLMELFNRVEVADEDNPQQIESLIETSHIVQGAGIYEGGWISQLELSNGQPIWMVNFLEYTEEANYRDHPEAAPTKPISGAAAYEKYGNSIGPSLAGVGGRIGWRSTALDPLPGTDDGQWHEIAIATYPSMQALMTMYAQPAYRAAHVHRLAAMARTRLVATQPIQEHKL